MQMAYKSYKRTYTYIYRQNTTENFTVNVKVKVEISVHLLLNDNKICNLEVVLRWYSPFNNSYSYIGSKRAMNAFNIEPLI